MAKAYITRHSVNARAWARLSSGVPIGAVGAQIGDALDLDLDDGEAHHTPPATVAGLYKVSIDGANVRLRIGEEAVADETGEMWFDGTMHALVFVQAGERLSVKVAA